MDTVGDFCTCIRNAAVAGHEKVDVPGSRIRQAIAEKLKKYHYIRGYQVVEDGRQGVMRIYLKYDAKRNSAIRDIQRVSRLSCRYYVKADQISNVQTGFGVAILSTNKGVLSGKEAKAANTGGEVLCQVW